MMIIKLVAAAAAAAPVVAAAVLRLRLAIMIRVNVRMIAGHDDIARVFTQSACQCHDH